MKDSAIGRGPGHEGGIPPGSRRPTAPRVGETRAPAPRIGRARSLHCKPATQGEHGLPKPSVAEFWLSGSGARGDFNRYRHEDLDDTPDQAVLLLPVETLRVLRAEGWPIQEGDLGENITTEGVPYDEFRPGDRFRIGGARVEISKPCTPCSNLYLLPYVGAVKGPEFVKATLGRRGWFARVLSAGPVRLGDAIVRAKSATTGSPKPAVASATAPERPR